MTDNIKVDPSIDQVDGIDVATDDVEGVHFPVYKMATGSDGEAELISSSNPVPIKTTTEPLEENTTLLLNEISKKLSVLIKYQAMLHGIDLSEEN